MAVNELNALMRRLHAFPRRPRTVYVDQELLDMMGRMQANFLSSRGLGYLTLRPAQIMEHLT